MNYYILVFLFVALEKRQSAALSSATHHVNTPENLAENGQRSVLALHILVNAKIYLDTA